MNYLNEIFISDRSNSGFYTAKPYSDMLNQVFSQNKPTNTQNLLNMFKILIEYLIALELSNFEKPNFDMHIFYNIEMSKIKYMPLFIKNELGKNYILSKDFQYIFLTSGIIIQLLMNLSEKLMLMDNPNSFKKIIRHERIYIESLFNYITNLLRKKYSDTTIFSVYESAYNNLISQFQDFHLEFYVPEGISTLLKMINERNIELNKIYKKILTYLNNKNLKIKRGYIK
jgi:hypothetical protein